LPLNKFPAGLRVSVAAASKMGACAAVGQQQYC
jgi:hypothetical protein